MQDLINKLLLFICGICIVWYAGVNDSTGFALTISLILSCLCTYFSSLASFSPTAASAAHVSRSTV